MNDNFRSEDIDKVRITGRGRQTRAASSNILIAAGEQRKAV